MTAFERSRGLVLEKKCDDKPLLLLSFKIDTLETKKTLQNVDYRKV